MRTFIVMLLLLSSTVTFAQANKAKQQPRPNPAKSEAWIFKNKELEITRGADSDSINYYPKLSDGNMWVFQYNYYAAEYAEISDDEYADALTFQLPVQKKTTFRLAGPALEKAHVIFQKSCFCADRGYFLIREGIISGKKINSSTWLVSVDIVIPPKDGLSAGHLRKKYTIRYHVQNPK